MLKKIPFVITTCKRVDLFKRTIESFLDCCLDKDLISEYVVADDGSSKEEIDKMSCVTNNIRFVINHNPGHANNLNNVYERTSSRWVFHCEDDWLFQKSGHFIQETFEIAMDDLRIKQVHLYRMLRDHGTENRGCYEVQRFARYSNSNNPTFSLNPCLMNLDAIKAMGLFKNIKWFELEAGYRFDRAGFLKANTMTDYITHIGDNSSAYNLNGTKR